MQQLVERFESLGAHIEIGNGLIRVVKNQCLVQRTVEGWSLYRSKQHPLGRFYAEHCTEDEALRMIRNGDVPRESESLSHREQARRLLSSAIRDNFGADSVQGEQLLEALDLLAS